MKQFTLDTYDILIDQPWAAFAERLKKLAPSRIGLLVDENTKRDCLPALGNEFDISDWHIFEIPAGERYKNIETCKQIWQWMMQAAFDRNSLLINLGGGVIGDMGGFCAATFKRGMRFIQMPTTLLSQVDASVGGKLGIDFLEIKNSIGVFRDPELVFIKTGFYNTLPFRELRSGFAEIIKHALIASPELWKKLQNIQKLEAADWASILPEALQVKIEVVKQDPYEKGLRKILNFGHTIGHAVESLLLKSPEPALHGEAVAAGMISESLLSEKYAGLSQKDSAEIQSFIHRIYPTLSWPKSFLPALLKLMKQDKKNQGDEIRFVLLEGIGSAVYDKAIPPEAILEVLDK
ncbi:MAG: 3-dehydroquinate synthase [Bacteroidetes bacterium]|nr:3-dehydroquinate synthase [Bacteroidota bacterium]